MILEETIRRLATLAASGVRPRLWLRDDDFCRFTPNFQALCAVLEYRLPLLVAAVPFRFRLSPEEIATLRRKPGNLMFCVHGYNHADNGSAAGGLSEYPPGRDIEAVRNELEFGLEKISSALPGKFRPVFVPPWNHVAAEYLPILKALGFRIVSGAKSRPQPETEGLRGLHVDVDVLTYASGPPYPMKRADVLDREFLGIIDGWDTKTPVLGVLSHHTGMSQTDLALYTSMIGELSAHCAPMDLGYLGDNAD